MSLLLDALKKAAGQKAKKLESASAEEIPTRALSEKVFAEDETLLIEDRAEIVDDRTIESQVIAAASADNSISDDSDIDETAIQIFAGMKAKEDVLMTPDYAKRVFLSQSPESRAGNNKIYFGIAMSILLAIGVYSLFQLQDEYDRIDSALMPLKRDPMPGVIQTAKVDGQEKLFSETETPDPDATIQTLKLVENAISTEAVASNEVENIDSLEGGSASEVIVVSRESETSDSSDSSVSNTGVDEALASEGTQSSVTKVAEITVSQASETSDSPTRLEISSNSKVVEKDIWLDEAYRAYQKGRDVLALEKYNQVLEVDPSNRNALLARAAIAVQQGESASAIKDYQALLLLNPKDSAAMASLLSIASTSPAASESQLKLMIRDEPDSPYMNFVLANIYGAQNRWQEAQRFYFNALEMSPENPNYAYNLAVSLEHIAKPQVAIVYYQRAIKNIKNGLATFSQDVVVSRIEMLQKL